MRTFLNITITLYLFLKITDKAMFSSNGSLPNNKVSPAPTFLLHKTCAFQTAQSPSAKLPRKQHKRIIQHLENSYALLPSLDSLNRSILIDKNHQQNDHPNKRVPCQSYHLPLSLLAHHSFKTWLASWRQQTGSGGHSRCPRYHSVGEPGE